MWTLGLLPPEPVSWGPLWVLDRPPPAEWCLVHLGPFREALGSRTRCDLRWPCVQGADALVQARIGSGLRVGGCSPSSVTGPAQTDHLP